MMCKLSLSSHCRSTQTAHVSMGVKLELFNIVVNFWCVKCDDFFCQLEYSNICRWWSDCQVLCRSYECVEEVIQRQEPLISVLRLLILLSITNNGLPKKHFDYFRWSFWNRAETSLLMVSNQDCHLLKFRRARFPWYKNHSTHIHSCFLWSLSCYSPSPPF